MKVQITVGPVEVAASGLDLSVRDLRGLMRHATDLALVVLDKVAEEDDDEKDAEKPNPVGFTAQVERAEPIPVEAYFTDDDE